MALGTQLRLDIPRLEGVLDVGQAGVRELREMAQDHRLEVGPVDQGRQSIETIFWNVIFGQVPPKIYNVRTLVVDKTNVDEPLAYVTWALGVPKI